MLKKTLGTFGAKLIGAILNFFIIILLSQSLGPEGKGEASLILTSIAMVLIVGNLVGGAPLVYLTPRKSIFQLIQIAYSWIVIIAILCYFLVFNFNLGIEPSWAKHIALLSLIEGLTAVNLAILIGKEKISWNNFTSILKSLFLFGFLIYGFQIAQINDLSTYLNGLYVSFSFGLLLSSYFAFQFIEFKTPDKLGELFKTLFKNGLLNQTSYILQFLSFRISYYIISTKLGDSELGIYSNAISIAESIWLISRSIALVQFSRIVNSDNLESNQKLTIQLFKFTFILTLFALIPLNLLPASFYELLFGEEFSSIKPIILFVSPGILAFNLFLIFGHYFSGIEKFKALTFVSLIGFIITLLTTLYLVELSGTKGVALATSISLIATTIFLGYKFKVSTHTPWRNFLIDQKDFKSIKLMIKQLTIK